MYRQVCDEPEPNLCITNFMLIFHTYAIALSHLRKHHHNVIQ